MTGMKKAGLLTLVAILVILLLVACNGGSDSDPAPSSSDTTTIIHENSWSILTRIDDADKNVSCYVFSGNPNVMDCVSSDE